MSNNFRTRVKLKNTSDNAALVEPSWHFKKNKSIFGPNPMLPEKSGVIKNSYTPKSTFGSTRTLTPAYMMKNDPRFFATFMMNHPLQNIV